MIKFVFIFLIFFFSICHFQIENGVLVLNNHNFRQALQIFPHILVKFYVLQCDNCKSILSEYEKTAQLLTELGSQIKLAKVDATQNQELAQEFKVTGFPTLYLFKKDKVIQYGGERNHNSILNWLKIINQPNYLVISRVQQYDSLLSVPGDKIFYFGQTNTEAYKIFVATSQLDAKYQFFIISEDANFFQEGQINSIHAFLPSLDGLWIKYIGNNNLDDILNWIQNFPLPRIFPFDQKAIRVIFMEEKQALLVMNLGYDTQNLFRILENNCGRTIDLLCSNSEKQTDNFEKISDFLNINVQQQSKLIIVNPQNVDIYIYPGSLKQITDEQFAKFYIDYKQNKLQAYKPTLAQNQQQHTQNDIAPQQNNFTIQNNILVLNSQNFNSAIDQFSNILIQFYAPWCGYCQAFAQQYSQAAKQIQNSGLNVKLAKIDATVSIQLAQKYKIQGYPTFIYFTSGIHIDYNGFRTKEGITQWIKKKLNRSITKIQIQLNKNSQNKQLKIFYYGDPDHVYYKTFRQSAFEDDSFSYYAVHQKQLIQHLQIPLIYAYRVADQESNHYNGDYTLQDLKNWITRISLPRIIPFGNKVIELIQEEQKSSLILINHQQQGSSNLLIILKNHCGIHLLDLFCVQANKRTSDYKLLLDWLNIKSLKSSKIFILNGAQRKIFLYQQPIQTFSDQSLFRFYQGYKTGNLLEYNIQTDQINQLNEQEHSKQIEQQNILKTAQTIQLISTQKLLKANQTILTPDQQNFQQSESDFNFEQQTEPIQQLGSAIQL